VERLSFQRRLEFGIVAGFVGSVASAILLTIFGGVGFFPYPIFERVGQSVGLAQPPVGYGITGLTVHLTVWLACGLIFALIFRRYTPIMGLGFAWIVTIGMMAVFLFGLPSARVDIFRMTFRTVLQFLLGFVLANSTYGMLLGLIGSVYLRQSKA